MNKSVGIILVTSFILFSLLSTQAFGQSPKIVQISAASDHSLALGDDGSVWEWGSNGEGSLTGNSSEKPIAPIRVPISNVVAISAGAFQNLALKGDGTVWVWGHSLGSHYGNMLSSGTGTFTPVKIPISNIKSVYSGNAWCFVVKNDGTVWAWGANDYGQLGDGNNTSTSYPVQVLVTNISSISPGVNTDGSIFAVDDNGDVWVWGSNIYTTWGDTNFYGLLSGSSTNSTNNTYPTPFKKDGLHGVSSISSGSDHVFALMKNGSLLVWGGNAKGQFGNGVISPKIFTYENDSTLVKINNVKAFSAGAENSLALKDDGTVWVWGPEYYGMVPSPAQVSGLTDVIAISAGAEHYLALKSDGTVWTWGWVERGQTGEARTDHYLSEPVQIKINFSSQTPPASSNSQNSTVNTQVPLDTSGQAPGNQAPSNDQTVTPSPGLLGATGIKILGVIGLVVLLGGVVYLIKRK